MMENMNTLLQRCVKASSGNLAEPEQSDLADQVAGAFATIPIIGTSIVSSARKRNWNAVVGGIGNYIDMQEASSPGTNVTNTVSVNANAYASAVAGIESLDGLDSDSKNELEQLILEVKKSKDKKMLKHAAKKLFDTAIDKGVETLPHVLPVVISAVQGLM